MRWPARCPEWGSGGWCSSSWSRRSPVEGGWDAAIAFCPDERRRLLECAAISTTEALADSTFETQSWQHRPSVTRLEFGAAWGRPEPTAVADLVVAEDRLLKAAAEQGMGSAVFVPVRNEGDTIAMVGLLSASSGAPGHELMLSLEGVGLHVGAIGHLLTRRRSSALAGRAPVNRSRAPGKTLPALTAGGTASRPGRAPPSALRWSARDAVLPPVRPPEEPFG